MQLLAAPSCLLQLLDFSRRAPVISLKGLEGFHSELLLLVLSLPRAASLPLAAASCRQASTRLEVVPSSDHSLKS